LKLGDAPKLPQFFVLEDDLKPRTHPMSMTYYRWERQAKEGMREALSGRRAKNGKEQTREIERLEAELERKRRIIAEVVEENLALKRGL